MATITITTTRTYLDHSATCGDCGRTWEGFPSDFLYYAEGLDAADAPADILRMGGGFWVTCGEVAAEGQIDGYCAPCAKAAADMDHEDYINGRWDQRDMEDERGIWAA